MQGGTLILLSGGIDSSVALAVAASRESTRLAALFIDYGQATAGAEAVSSANIARHYGVPHHRLELHGLRFSGGEIPGRNAFLLHAAMLAVGRIPCVVTIGVHAGTPYRDCTEDFLDVMRRSYEFHSGGTLTLAAPFIDRLKSEVFDLALDLGVPLALTYSCEVDNRPCHECASCRDREMLLARA